MTGWLSQHAQALLAAVRKLAVQRASSLLNVLVIGIALALPTGGYLLLANLQSVAARFTLEPQVSVYMDAASKPADRNALEGSLRKDSRVSTVRFVAKEAALAELKKTEGIADVVATLGENPLPDSFVIRLRAGHHPGLDAFAGDLRKRPGVAGVQADSGWARRLAALIEIGRLSTAILGALLAAGMVAVTFNTIRLQVLTQRAEIEVSRLLGAADSFIRRPFYYVGALQGLAGGMVAIGVVAGALHLMNDSVRALSQSYGSSFEIGFLAPGDMAAITLFAGLLGWLGAYLSVSIYLREIEHQ